MKSLVIVFSIFLFVFNAFTQREKINFNYQWQLYVGDTLPKDESLWKNVSLPVAFNEDDAFRKAINELTTGIAWYRKFFYLPKKWNNKKIFIEFEGVRQAAEIYVNNNKVALHENGVMAFGIDLTPYLNFGNKINTIVVRTDNRWDYREKSTGTLFQWHNKNFNANYGGIIKNVFLHITNKVYQTLPLYSFLNTTGVYVYAKNINVSNKKAIIFVESEIKNETDKDKKIWFEFSIHELDGKLKAKSAGKYFMISKGSTVIVKDSVIINSIELWSWGYGYLYDVKTKLIEKKQIVDEVSIITGFRKTFFGNGMVYLNDCIIQLKGYAQRSTNEWPALGSCVPPWVSDFSNQLIVDGNGNLIRWMHVTPWKQDIESCDRLGIIQAMPAGDAEKDVEGRQWQQRLELMRDAIIYNRNNPSILFYECGNENISEEHMLEMKLLRDKYDPYGGRAIGSREMLDSKIAEYGGEMLYINKSAGKPMWAMEYSRDEGLRKYWDEFLPPFHKDGDGPLYRNAPAHEYNRNQDSHAIENVIRWYDYYRVRPGTGKRVGSGGANIIFSDSNTHFRGAENYRRSGEVDAVRLPKDCYFAHKVMWNGWLEPDKTGIHIVGHWNYFKGVVKNVYVISTADKVEVKVNGKSYGYGRKDYKFLFTFDSIRWEPGILEAIGYNTSGDILCYDRRITTGEPYKIKLSLHTAPGGLKADGNDIAIIDVEVVDTANRRNPVANNLINFKLYGEAQWRGGIAQGNDNYILSTSIPVECGINRVLIRSTTKAGEIKVVAVSEGLISDTLIFNSITVDNSALSRFFPSFLQPTYLKRGPTPINNTLNMVRRNIIIKDAIAPVNIEKLKNCFDDNELTYWENDGKLFNGWITFILEKDTIVDEIEMKLCNFRRIKYPLEILVNDKIVWSGLTQLSLGYITIKFTPTRGNAITVRLKGSVENDNKFNYIKELEKENEQQRGTDKGYLGIIEFEVFKRLFNEE